jgi:phage gpG-like protein
MAGLNAFIQRLERMAAADVKQRIAAKITPVAHEECLRGFREQRDPYGAPWAPRKKIGDGHPILDNGRGPTTLTSRTVGDRSVLRIVDIYKFHQRGTSKMVARKVFPEQERGLGLWSDPINRAAVDAVRELAAGRV